MSKHELGVVYQDGVLKPYHWSQDEEMREILTDGECYGIEIILKPKKQRNILMNKCLHLFCRIASAALNEAGIDMVIFLTKLDAIAWDRDGYNFKDRVWRPVQKVFTGESSTTRPTDAQYCEIYKHVSKHMAEKHGVVVEWPSNEKKKMDSLMEYENGR